MTRLHTALVAIVIVICGLGVRALWDGPVAKYAGDALYTALIYALLVLLWPRIRPWTAGIAAAALSWMIEFAQLASIPRWLQPLLGSTFNPPDLLWYAVGAAMTAVAHAAYTWRG
ncbi:ribosomal maturation YjgA family protein [Nonomuraea maritima]|uniref:ribosomal maturation YjgA family protein n=1 Tax=Nonomuraea maritima TaxID=683260 RepID=UPI0037104917